MGVGCVVSVTIFFLVRLVLCRPTTAGERQMFPAALSHPIKLLIHWAGPGIQSGNVPCCVITGWAFSSPVWVNLDNPALSHRNLMLKEKRLCAAKKSC